MLKKIAFASYEGTAVDSHFGMADMFYIYEISGRNYSLIEKRRYSRGAHRCHDESNFEKAYEALKDCDAVFAAKIGQSAADFLIKKNLRVFQIEAQIEEILKEIIKDNKNVVNDCTS
jgi:predicted Fe-Mo cluster-binding NifX family protein